MTTQNQFPNRMSRSEASEYLWQIHGLKYATGTLAKLAHTGGGPGYRKAGLRRTLYDQEILDQWAKEKLGPVLRSSADKSSSGLSQNE